MPNYTKMYFFFSLENTMSGNRNLLSTYIKDLARGVGQTLALKSYVLLTFIVYRTSLVIINYWSGGVCHGINDYCIHANYKFLSMDWYSLIRTHYIDWNQNSSCINNHIYRFLCCWNHSHWSSWYVW